MLPSMLAGAPSSPARHRQPTATATAVLLRAARTTAAIPDFRARPAALAQINGVKATGHATTVAGRTGIAVAAYDPSRGTLDELIFDPKTYLYIGDLEIALNSRTMPEGTVNGTAVLQIAVTDKPGQLP